MNPNRLSQPLVALVPIINLAECEKQPIHIPGSIQPVGLLLAVRARDLTILQVSDNLPDLLGVAVDPLLNQSLAQLTGEPFRQTLEKQLANPIVGASHTKLPPLHLTLSHAQTGQDVTFDVLVTRNSADLLLVELEPQRVESHIQDEQMAFVLKTLIQEVYDCQTIEDLIARTATAVRQVSGFDRVMVYRFHEDWHGEVLAEAKVEGLEPSYNGLHFPASDIPKQARELYLTTPLRLIGAVAGTAARLIPERNPDTGDALDLSLATLRSVSPTHTYYLQTMGVAASMSISIFQGTTLWGLIVCHHQSPHWVPFQIRTLCELLGQVISLQLMNLTEASSLTSRLIRKEHLAALIEQLNLNSQELPDLLLNGSPSLAQVFDLQGLVVRQKVPQSDSSAPGIAADTSWGTVPTIALPAIAEWLAQTGRQSEVVLTDCFSQTYQTSTANQTSANGNDPESLPEALASVAGLFYLPLSDQGDEFILGFREELAKTVEWYCNISEETLPQGSLSLGPSYSYKRWQQSIRGQSQAFTELHQELADHLRLALLERLNRDARRQTERQLQDVNVVLAKELHERKVLESQLVHAQKMESLGQLAAGVAHEINNPIGFVKSNLSTLTDYVQSFKRVLEESRKLVDTLKTSSGHAADETTLLALEALFTEEEIPYIMEDVDSLLSESCEGTERVRDIVKLLRSFVRLDEEDWKPAEVNEGLESTLKIIWNEVKYKCTVHRDYGEVPPLFCNMGQLNQVFMNLMINAVQAIEDKGELRITTRSTDEEVTVTIADTGSGIPADKLKDIFNPFFTTKPVGKGTGLGLSISYNIIEKHGGRIDVDSVPGEGSTFTVRLPRRQNEPAAGSLFTFKSRSEVLTHG